MTVTTLETKRKPGRPKGSGHKRAIVIDMLRQLDCDPVARIVEQLDKPDMPDTEVNRLLLGLMPYTYMRLPQEQVVSNPQALSLTINLGDKDKEVKTIEHEDE